MNAPSFRRRYADGGLNRYVREQRSVGLQPIRLFELVQPAGDFSDPPLSDLLVCIGLSSHRVQARNGNARLRGRQSKGDVVVHAPDVATEIVLDDHNAFRVVALSKSFAAPLLQGMRQGDLFDFGALHGGGQRNACIEGLVGRLWQEAGNGGLHGPLFIDGLTVALLGELAAVSGGSPRKHSPGVLDPRRLRRACELLTDDVGAARTIAAVAGEIGLSPHHFARAFKGSTGLPPHAWSMRHRVGQAKILMLSTQDALADIAAACGFASQQHFTTAFKRHVGATPAAWRRERRGSSGRNAAR